MFEYANRKDQIYYLYQGITKTGKPKYYFSKTKKEGGLDKIPECFEIYENPNSQVFLLKKEERLITEKENQVVVTAVNNNNGIWGIVDVKKKHITIHTAERTHTIDDELISPFLSSKKFAQFLHYMPEMRFTLIDPENRLFVAQRFCYRSSVDDWIMLGVPTKLDQIVEQYVNHLGKESFYELY